MAKKRTSTLLCKECVGTKSIEIAKKKFGDKINKIFDGNTCGKCGKHSPSADEFLFNAAIQSGKIKWWNE